MEMAASKSSPLEKNLLPASTCPVVTSAAPCSAVSDSDESSVQRASTCSSASKDALAQVDQLSGELRRVRAQRDAVQGRRDAELLSEAEAREERRVLNGQLDQVQESLDQAEALLGRTGSLREFLPPFTPLTRGPVQVERRPGIDCCAGVRTGLFVPWTWSLRERREDVGEHGGSAIASG